MTEREVLLEIHHLKAYFPVKRKSMKEEKKVVKAVDDVSIEIFRGETLGIVGESGSGKSTFGRTILKLVEPTDGEILYKGQPIQHLKGRHLQKYRNQMQMIFQDPFASLNPRMRIGSIIEEPMALQLTLSKEQRKKELASFYKRLVYLMMLCINFHMNSRVGNDNESVLLVHLPSIQSLLLQMSLFLH